MEWNDYGSSLPKPHSLESKRKGYKWNKPQTVQQMGRVSYPWSRIVNKFWGMENVYDTLQEKKKTEQKNIDTHMYICKTRLHCCTPETKTTLKINYPPILKIVIVIINKSKLKIQFNSIFKNLKSIILFFLYYGSLLKHKEITKKKKRIVSYSKRKTQ